MEVLFVVFIYRKPSWQVLLIGYTVSLCFLYYKGWNFFTFSESHAASGQVILAGLWNTDTRLCGGFSFLNKAWTGKTAVSLLAWMQAATPWSFGQRLWHTMVAEEKRQSQVPVSPNWSPALIKDKKAHFACIRPWNSLLWLLIVNKHNFKTGSYLWEYWKISIWKTKLYYA